MSGEHVIITNAGNFARDVIDASHQRPVLVDFWAEWCGPCRSIAPVLEQIADDLDGALVVAKVDTDAEQELAQTYGIRSLPTMLLFRDGAPVEQIIGAQSATVIRAAVDKQLPRAGTALIAAAMASLAAGDTSGAGQALEQALALDPEDYSIHPLLAQIHLKRGDYRAAEKLLETLPINVATDDAFKSVRATLHLASQLPADIEHEHLVSNAADDIEARYLVSVRDGIEGRIDASLESLFDLLAQHRAWRDGAIHKTILDVFRLLAEDDPRLKTYRTRLARTLN